MCVVSWVWIKNASQNLLLMTSLFCIAFLTQQWNAVPSLVFGRSPSVVNIKASTNLIKQDHVQHFQLRGILSVSEDRSKFISGVWKAFC